MTLVMDDLDMPADPADTDVITLGEVYRLACRIEQNTRQSFKALDDRLTSTLVTRDSYVGDSKVIDERVGRLESQSAAHTAFLRTLSALCVAELLTLAGTLLATHLH